jgi:hypothetical protein
MPIPPDTPSHNDTTGKKASWHWAVLLPLVLGAGLVMSQIRDNEEPSTPPRDTNTNSTVEQPPKQYSTPSSVLVVGTDDKLHRKPWKADSISHPSADLPDVRTRLIRAVVEASPQSFPAGTQVRSVEIGENEARVDFNRNFAQPQFWQGETKTLLAVYSVVNTLASVNAPEGRNLPIRLLVEGKPIQTLGEFDTSDPIEPDYTLVAKD